MSKLLDRLLYKHSSDQVKILLDRMDSYPEEFAKHRPGIWSSKEMLWMELAEHGVFGVFERWAINRKLKVLNIKACRDRVLDLLINNGDSGEENYPKKKWVKP